MAGRRLPRLNEQLRRDIAELLRTQVRDPRVTGVTVTGVEVTNDLSLARVYVRVAGGDAERDEALVGLEAASPFIRRAVGQELRIRRVPELRFQHDASGDHAARIDAILREVVPPGGFPPEEPEGDAGGDAPGSPDDAEPPLPATGNDHGAQAPEGGEDPADGADRPPPAGSP